MRALARILPLLAAALLLVSTVGCSTFESRAREKSAVFAAIDETTRARLATGDIRVGDEQDWVYIALGRPDSRSLRQDASTLVETWIYQRFRRDYLGTRLVGHRPEIFLDRATNTYRVIYFPDYQPIYLEYEEDVLRVEFIEGRVSAIEVPAPGRPH